MNNTVGFAKWFIIRLIFLSSFLIILLGIIAYARGYRFDVKRKALTSTGIISVNSNPEPATVYVNGELKGVTDLDLTLPHNHYTVEVKKDGYTEWKRDLALKGEIVMSIDAMLFSKNPSLSPLTSLGISRAITIGQTERLLLFSENNTVGKDGIYLFDGTKRAISIFPPLKPVILKAKKTEGTEEVVQILPENIELSSADVVFSPDNEEGIFTFNLKSETEMNEPLTETDGKAESTEEDEQNESTEKVSYLLSLTGDNSQLTDVTGSKDVIINAWNKEKNKQVLKILETFPKEIRKVATDSVQIVSLSPDETKILYVAKKEVTLPLVIKPPLIGANQTPEERALKENGIYVYDKKEDKNFRVPVSFTLETENDKNVTVTPTPTPTLTQLEIDQDPEATLEASIDVLDEEVKTKVLSQLQWFPTSRHLITRQDDQIAVMEYDGKNKVVVYSGPFQNKFFASTASYNLLVVVNLNPQNNTYGDLYTIGIR